MSGKNMTKMAVVGGGAGGIVLAILGAPWYVCTLPLLGGLAFVGVKALGAASL